MDHASSALERLMTTEQAADYLNIPPATLAQWRAQRKGPRSYSVGLHVRYRRQDIDDWLVEREQRVIVEARRAARIAAAAGATTASP